MIYDPFSWSLNVRIVSDIDVVSYPFLLPDIPWRFPAGNLRLEDFQKTYSIYLNSPELQVWKNLFLVNFDFCCRD